MSSIVIRQYESRDRDAVRDMFCKGLRSYNHPPHLYEAEILYSERALKEDMDDIGKHYIDRIDAKEEGRGNFWVAEEEVYKFEIFENVKNLICIMKSF